MRDDADIIITNPPFSLFREYVSWIIEGGKRFALIGNQNAITYKEIFPLIKDNKIWLGVTRKGQDMLFDVPESYARELTATKKEGSAYKIVEGVVKGRLGNAAWFTNINHGRRHELLSLMTMDDNVKFSKHKEVRGIGYKRYDNYDAIEVPFTDAIPADYDGVMGVPITFLDKHNPEQFEILGTSDNGIVDAEIKTTPGLRKKFVDDYYASGGTGTYREGNPTAGYYKDGVANMAYKRIFIRHIRETK